MVQVLEFCTKHFLVLSTVITSLLTSITFIFIVSYLSVFDFSIIWIIEYTDIVKFVFIALGLVAGLVLFIFQISRISILSLNGIKRNRILLIGFIIAIFLVYALDIWVHRTTEGRWFFSVMVMFSYIMLIILIFGIRETFLKWPNESKWESFACVALFIVAISVFGKTYGLSVKFSGPNHNDVLIKDAQTLHDVTIIMILSHHSIFQVDRAIVIIPSANVTRIVHTTE